MRKIAIYGAGRCGVCAYEILLMIGCEIYCFLDSSKEKQGTLICGTICRSPDTIIGNDEFQIVVALGVEHFNEVKQEIYLRGHKNVVSFSDALEMILDDRKFFRPLLELAWKHKDAALYYNLPMSRLDVQGEVKINEKVAVYTSVFGDYDDVVFQSFESENLDFYYISDEKPPDNYIGRWIDGTVLIPNSISNPIYRNRFTKMHPHLIFPEYKYSIYVDGNIEIFGNVSAFIKQNKTGISAFQHPYRNCIYWEFLELARMHRVNLEATEMLFNKYYDERFPKHYGLFSMNVIAREHRDEACIEIMNKWWDEFVYSGTARDQFSFTHVLWKMGFKNTDIGCIGHDPGDSDVITVNKHRFRKSGDRI